MVFRHDRSFNPTDPNARCKPHSAQDQSFTNLAHQNLAPAFYEQIFPGVQINQASVADDLKKGIDYYLTVKVKNPNGVGVQNIRLSIQERFRRIDHPSLLKSKEFTLRYSRPDSLSAHQKQSEFFKIEATYLYYAITNAVKATDRAPQVAPTKCIRQVLVNLKQLMRLVNEEKILIGQPNTNPWVDRQGVPHIGMRQNKEKGAAHNSWLVIFNVEHLVECGLVNLNDRARSVFPAHEGYLQEDDMQPAARVQPATLASPEVKPAGVAGRPRFIGR